MTSLQLPVRPVPDDSLLTSEEVIALQRQIEAGVLARHLRLSEADPAHARPMGVTDIELRLLERLGDEARQRFVRANLPLVRMVARQYTGRGGVGYADLVQEGCLGLIIAVERFDYARGHRFSTYALFWVRAFIQTSTARQFGDLNLPASRSESLRAAHTVEAELTQQYGRTPTLGELAAALGRNERWTAGLMAHQRPRSIDEIDPSSVDDAGALAAFDRIVGRDALVRGMLDRLAAEPRRVLELRLGFATGEPESLAETARRLGTSVGRIRRMEAAALETLRGLCPQQAHALL